MRTNIDIDDKLMKQAMKATGATTKKGAVEAALLRVVQLKKQEGIKKLRGKVKWEGDLDAMRESRRLNWDEEFSKKKPKESAA
ncbi:MAG TPA: type II toxin-antitoxin system VapB family antitoxin [Terracidiphilus sp.]|jgi:Arc/MetJ family transcription regulator|nr:type II toxin-antitoxin system VapB family antitoxin [Terracidiphilus sp.]